MSKSCLKGCPINREDLQEIVDCCHSHNIFELRSLALKSKNKLNEFANERIRELFYGYTCRPDLEENIDKLTTYLKYLNKIIRQKIYDEVFNTYYDEECKKVKKHVCCTVCLNCNKLQCLIEKIISIIGKNCRILCQDLYVDDSLENEWILCNPGCLSYECWDKWSKLKVAQFDIKLSKEEILEKLLIEASVKSVTDEILTTVKVINVVEDLSLKLELKDTPQMKVELKLLLEKVPTANIDLKLYKQLVEDYNISFDIIKEVYENNLELELKSSAAEKEELHLKTSVYSYPLSELKINIKAEDLSEELKIKYKQLLSEYKHHE